VVLVIFLLQSCTTQNLFETPEIKTRNTYLFSSSDNYEYHIRKDDKLNISIWNHNDLSVGSIFDVAPGNEEFGKWVMVDHYGKITVPYLGEIQVEGCTIQQLETLLKDSFDTTIKDPVIIVKVLNKEVTILGEVRNPGAYLIDKEKNSISEIIGRAGGLDVYADQKQVKLIRKDENGTQQYQFDLTRMDDFDKANLLVMPGDVLNIPSRKGKMFDRKIPTVSPFIAAISLIVVFYSLVLKK
jgi:polysaccharide export outer membrane protein